MDDLTQTQTTKSNTKSKSKSLAKKGQVLVTVPTQEQHSTQEQHEAVQIELAKVAVSLGKALKSVDNNQASALKHAYEAGRQMIAAKEILAANPLIIQTFAQWFRANVKGHSLRSAHRYEIVYKQMSADSKTVYQSITDVFKSWRVAHPKKKRFMPENFTKDLKEERKAVFGSAKKERKDKADTDRADLIGHIDDFERPDSEEITTGMQEWLGSPQCKQLRELVTIVLPIINENPSLYAFFELFTEAARDRIEDREFLAFMDSWDDSNIPDRELSHTS